MLALKRRNEMIKNQRQNGKMHKPLAGFCRPSIGKIPLKECASFQLGVTFMRPPPRGVTTTTPPLGIELQIQKVARARARLFSRLRNFAGGLAKVSLSEAIRFR